MNTARAWICVILLCASAHAGAAIRAHAYPLNGSYADQLGGPALITGGGALSVNGYYLNTGEGPSLAGAINPTNYSIELLFYIKDTNGWRKLLDFKDRTTDAGLYSYFGATEFYPTARDTNVAFVGGQITHVVMTRAAANSAVGIYVNGNLRLTFTDSAQNAVLSTPARVLHILRDDATTTSEDPRGFLDRLQVFDGPLTASEVAALHGRIVPALSAVRTGPSLAVRWTNLPVLFQPQMLALNGPEMSWVNVPHHIQTNGLLAQFVAPVITNQPPALFRLVEAP